LRFNQRAIKNKSYGVGNFGHGLRRVGLVTGFKPF